MSYNYLQKPNEHCERLTMRRPKAKRFSASGGFAPDPAGGSAPDPHYRVGAPLNLSWSPWPEVLAPVCGGEEKVWRFLIVDDGECGKTVFTDITSYAMRRVPRADRAVSGISSAEA